MKNKFKSFLLIALMSMVGVSQVHADWYVQGTGTGLGGWGQGAKMTQSPASTDIYYRRVSGTCEFKVTSQEDGYTGEKGSGAINNSHAGANVTLSNSNGNIKSTQSGTWYICYDSNTSKVYAQTSLPAPAPTAVVSGTSFMFYIKSYDNWRHAVTPNSTSNRVDGTFAGTDATSWVTVTSTQKSTYTYITNNRTGWGGKQNSNISSTTGGQLYQANDNVTTTAAKTAATTASVTGDLLSISTTTNSTTGVYGSLSLYIQYYIDGAFTGVTYSSSTASYGSITAGGATARASTYDVSGLTNGSHTLKTVLTDGNIFWVADQDNFTVAHVYSITYKDQGDVTYSGSNGASLPSSYTYGTGIASLTDGVRAGYDFGGWFDNSSCTGSAVTSISTTATGAKTFYAKWTASATNSLATSAGVGISSTSGDTNPVTLGNKYDISATVATGYTFSGWTASPVANGTFDNASSASTKVKVQNGSVTVTASATENKSTLTTSNHYDAGNPSYSAPTKSVSSIGISTTSNLTATAASTGYTFVGWTLTHCVRTDGGASDSRTITVRSDGSGSAATAVANYEEDLSTTWSIAGSFNSWSTSSDMFEKLSGSSTGNIAYCTLDLEASTTYTFQVVEGGSNWKGNTTTITETTNDLTFTAGSYNNCTLETSEAGNYTFKIDFTTATSPSVSVSFPPVVELTSSVASEYSGTAITLTAESENLVSGKTIKYEFFKGDNTLPANLVATQNLTTSSTTHSTTQSVTPSFNGTDAGSTTTSQVYTVKITYDGSTTATSVITVYRKWDIYVQDNCSWGNIYNYNWDASDNHGFGGWPGTASSVYSGSWRTITLDGKYPNVILNGNNNEQTHDIETSISTYAAGTFWNFVYDGQWESTKYYNLNSVTISNPTVELTNYDVINTTQIYVKGNITNFGNDGNSAAEMQEVGFKVGETEYTTTCTDGSTFERYITGLTANTSYSVKAYATNLHGTGESAATAKTTRATGTYTIKVRSGVSDPVPYIYAFVWSDGGCGGSNTTANAAWPGVAMTLDITGTTYKWYSYTMSNVYSKFKISENEANDTYDFDAPLEDKCYWYHSYEATQGDRMGTMDCPYTTPQLMIEETAGEEDFTYLEMSTSPTISKTVTLAAKSTYLFKIVYNAEWYGKASVNLSRAANSVSSVSAAIEDNMAITTDVAGDYKFTFTTPGTITVTYPTAYTVTFGKGTGGSTISASATSAGGTLTSGDYVAAGDNVTFTQSASSGYTFAGWYDASTGGSAVPTMGVSDNVLNSIGANATVYSRYTPNNYTVTFDATTNGGTCGTASKGVTFDAAYGDLPEATKDAKVFAGWYTTASGAGTQVTDETIVSTADDHTLYARFEDTYSVTIQYKSGDVTLKPNGSTTASATALAPEITAPEFLGYTFTGWTGTSATFANESSATTTVNVTAATTITANYTAIPTVYFKNNLGWEHVYVTFDCNWVTAGGKSVPSNNTKPYFEMTQLGTSDIFSCRIPDAYVTSSYAGWKGNIAFDNKGFDATDNVGSNTAFNAGEFLGRGDFDPSATMFIPYNGDSETRNGGTYYRTGCWMKYNSTDPGYKLYVDYWKEGSGVGSGNVTGTPVLLTAGIAGGFEFKATVNLSTANYTYGFMLHKEYTKNSDAIWYTNTSTITAETDDLPWHFYNDGASEDGTRCGLKTESTGDYEFTVSFGTGRPVVNVTYPTSVGDWRLAYNDRIAWSGSAHAADWYIYSRVIKAEANAEDIVSFYVSKAAGANAHIELQKCTAINALTGAETWTKQGSNLDISAITATGIYNFKVTQNESKVASAAYDGSYDGNFYIRTDASDGGWSNYKTSGTNTMTYSEYAKDNSGFTHYFMRYVTKDANIRFCIANDYSPCLTEYCIDDDYTHERIEANGNVRFMWDHRTNAVSRAYISGSSIVSDRFLVLEGDNRMFDENGNALSISGLNANEMNFTDDQNWIYEATIQAKPGAKALLTAKYNNKIQYFGGSGPTNTDSVLLIGGSDANKYKIRVVYDFKTNRMIKAFIPAGEINTDLEINADLMIIREAQGDAQQITFGANGALSEVKTVYGAMKFNKYNVNNKSKEGGHGNLGWSRYKRDLFYISFPFDVKLSDVFGFGTYGKHWIIEYYDGKERAANGFWAETETFWKFVMPSQRSSFTMKANEGYILALDLDEMTESSSIWNNDVQDVYVYFPSNGNVNDIEATNKLVTIDQTGYECTIGPRFDGGDDRTKKDSYWHCIGVPGFANYNRDLTVTNGGATINWSDDDGTIDWSTASFPYLYEWNSTDNSLSVTTSATFAFKPMYSYMVQYAGASIYWSQINSTPSGVVARQKDAPTNIEFRLELQQGEQKADQAFVRLTDDELVTTGYDFNYDLSKEFNGGKANIYTMITSVTDNQASLTEAAGNVLPMTEQTTVVPVGVKITTDGDYTFSIPEGTEGVGVTLLDTETGIRTSLSALDYTVSLEAGTYNDRFVIEISPIQHVATDVESTGNDAMNGVRKLLIDGLLYIVRDGKMFDARGARVE